MSGFRFTPVSVSIVVGVLSFAFAAALGIAVQLFPERRAVWADFFVLFVAITIACVIFLLLEGGAASVRRIRRKKPPQPPHGGAASSVPEVEVDAEIHIRVHRALNETGNAAGEPFHRWIHLQAENWSAIDAEDASIRIRIDPLGIEREWMWTRARPTETIKRGSPVAIPIARGNIAEPPTNWIGFHGPHFPVGKWYFTPEGHVGGTIEAAPGRYFIHVTVTWHAAGGKSSTTDTFYVYLPPRNGAREPEIIHSVDREHY